MRKFIKILAGFVAVLTGLVLIAFAILVNLDFNDYREDIAAEVTKATGRPFAIKGDLEVELSLIPIIKASRVVMGNAGWSANPDMLKIDSISVEADLLSFISGPPDIHDISVSGVEIILETAPSGMKNYEFSTASDSSNQPQQTTGSPKDKLDEATGKISTGTVIPIFRQIALSDIKVRFLDEAQDVDRTLTVAEVSLLGDDPSEPMQLAIEAHGDKDVSLVLNGVLGSLETVLDPTKPWSVDVFGDVAGIAVDISGAIADPTSGQGVDLKIVADGPELSKVAETIFLH